MTSPKNSRRRPTLASDDRGQATAEYALLVLFTVLPMIIAMQLLWQGILNYYQDIASLICLPIP